MKKMLPLLLLVVIVAILVSEVNSEHNAIQYARTHGYSQPEIYNRTISSTYWQLKVRDRVNGKVVQGRGLEVLSDPISGSVQSAQNIQPE